MIWRLTIIGIIIIMIIGEGLKDIINYVISLLFCNAFMHVCLLMPCCHLLGKG